MQQDKTYNNNSKLVSDDVDSIKRRLVIENDDRLYSLKDCLQISQQTGIPIVFDSFHHECYSNEEQQLLLQIALQRAMSTWKSSEDGLPIVDYSSQDTRNKEDNKSSRKGKHAETIDTSLFRKFLKETEGLDFDIMLEIKDKEKSALKALEVVREHRSIVAPPSNAVVLEHD
jgi:UV DNA damage endonuclease